MNLQLITVPYGLAERKGGVGAGPDRILSSGLVGDLQAAGHHVRITGVDLPTETKVPEALALFQANRLLAGRVREAVDMNEFPVVLAGNCATAAGTLAGLGDAGVGLLWLDAHGDFNTPETTISGYLDGMALAIATGRCWRQLADSIPDFCPVPEEHVALLGSRDLDPREAEALSNSSITLLTSDQMRVGLRGWLSALQRVVRDVYLHIDVDVLDPAEGRASAHAADGGLSARELLGAFETIVGCFRVRAVAVTAYDPAYDPDGRVSAFAAGSITAILSSITASGGMAP